MLKELTADLDTVTNNYTQFAETNRRWGSLLEVKTETGPGFPSSLKRSRGA